jgi:hypothetical protein
MLDSDSASVTRPDISRLGVMQVGPADRTSMVATSLLAANTCAGLTSLCPCAVHAGCLMPLDCSARCAACDRV